MPKLSNVPAHDTAKQELMTDAVLETPGAEVPEPTGFARLGRSNFVLFLAWFALILLLKWPTLTQPPVWDGSMSVFPAAITLAENDFDLGYLLEQPGYADGGPNVHSVSLVTWLTAGIIWLLGDTSALFPLIHLVHFAIAAATMAGLYRFAKPLLGNVMSATALVAVLLFPLVLTQAGYMYLEFPMLAATTFALLSWTGGRLAQTTFWSVAAVLIKGAGIIVPAAIAGMALFDPRPTHRDRRSGLVVLLLSTTVLAVAMWVTPGGSGATDLRDHLAVMIQYLRQVPDLLILMVGYLAATVLLAPWRPKPGGDRSVEPVRDDEQNRLLSVAFLFAAFFGFYLLVPVVLGIAAPILPRYYVQVFPFAIVGLLAALRLKLDDRVLVLLLLLMMVWSGINRNGDMYADNNINSFALIERSGAYTDLLDLQIMGIRALQDLPGSIPVFYDQPAHYKLGYPLMGYAEEGLANGHSIRHELPFRNGRLEDFPPEFYMLYESGLLDLGREIIRSIWEQAESDPNREVVVDVICSAAFCSGIIHVMPATVP